MIYKKIIKGGSILGSLLLSLIFILSIAFFIKNASHQFPDEHRVSYETGFANQMSLADKRTQVIKYGKSQKLNRPQFYFSIRPSHYPKMTHKILPLREQKAVRKLLLDNIPGKLILSWREKVIHQLDSLPQNKAVFLINLLQSSSRKELSQNLRLASKGGVNLPRESETLVTAKAGFTFPTLHWHGSQNQWHLAGKNFLFGNWGVSRIDGQAVSSKIFSALPYTLFINGAAIILLFLTAILLGSWWVRSKNRPGVQISRQIAYFLYVMPLFWLSALAIAFLTQPTGIFPLSSGMESKLDYSHYLLPLLCIWLSSFGYLSRMFEDKLRSEWSKPYIQLAQHRGIPQRKLLFSYALPNAIIPIITLLGAAFPALVSGSLIIEVLFNIPGMGRLIWWSLQEQDWPVVFNVILIIGFFAWLGRWGADQWSRYLDPRMKWTDP